MNVNPNSADYGKIVPWGSLTEEQRKSGDWILLPTHNEDGEPAMAKRKNPLDSVFRKFDSNAAIMRDTNRLIERELAARAGRTHQETEGNV